MSGRPARPGRHAIVVFADRPDCAWLRLLKPGFRHCFAALREGGGWLVLDPLLERIELAWIEPAPWFDLPRFYAAQGHIVLTGMVRHPEPRPRLPRLTPLTCVSAVKRLLGIHAAGVLTPWQLFRYLTGRQSYAPVPALPAPGADVPSTWSRGHPRSNSSLTSIPK